MKHSLHLSLAFAIIALFFLASCVASPSPAMQTMQPTMDVAGANAGMTLTAVVAQRAMVDQAEAQAGLTVTAEARATHGMETHIAQQATYAAATPTAAAIQTQSVITREAQVAEAQGTQAAIALLAAREASDATATIEAREDNSTATAAAWGVNATSTVSAQMREEETLERQARNDENMAWFDNVAQVAIAALLAAFLVSGLILFTLASRKRLRQPTVLPSGVILSDPANPVTVHDPARQFNATANTSQVGLLPGVSPEMQFAITRMAQQNEAIRMAFTAVAQTAVQQGNGACPALPGVPVSATDLLKLLGAPQEAPLQLPPRIIVVEGRGLGPELISAGVSPAQAAKIEDDWLEGEYVDAN